jgi:GT2 family glycosyltransferase
MNQPFLVLVVLNFNRREDTLKCLSSVKQNTYNNYKVILLDNNSTDGSIQAVRSTYPEVQIIELNENRGYAGNNNVGIKAALEEGADWVFVLNEDTILDPECLSNMVITAESDPQIGILGPMVYHHDEPDVIQSAGGMLGPNWESIHLAKNELDVGQFDRSHPVEWISGCAIMVRRAAIEQDGMIDERFFYYWEETEWCLRIGKAGWRIVHVPQAKIWHKGVQRDYHPKPSVTYYSTRNRLLLLAKHQAPLRVWVFVCLQILRTLTSWTIKPKWREMQQHRNAMWKGIMDFSHQRWGKMSS